MRLGARRTALGCFLSTAVGSTPVVNASFGLFLLPVSRDLHWPRTRMSLALTLLALCSAVVFPVAGRLADRLGARRVVLAGAMVFPCCLASLSLLGQGGADTLPVALASFALLGAAAALPGPPLLARLVSGWFSERRGLVLGLVAGGGNGIGCALMPILAAVVIDAAGWRAAYLALAATALLIGLFSALVLLRDPAPVAAGVDAPGWVPGMGRAEAMRTRSFWLLLLLLGLGAGALTAVFTHVAPILLDRGLSTTLAAAAVSVVALSGSAWQPVMGAILDRTGDPRWLAPGLVSAIIGLALLARATGPVPVLAGAVLVGVAIGSDYGAVPLLIGRLFGLRAFGAISGTLYGINVAVLGIAPFLADLGFESTGSYRITLIVAGCCLAGCVGCCLALPRFGRD